MTKPIKEPEAMQEIHRIMEKLHERRKNMTEEQILQDIHSGSQEAIKRYKLKLHKPRTLATK